MNHTSQCNSQVSVEVKLQSHHETRKAGTKQESRYNMVRLTKQCHLSPSFSICILFSDFFRYSSVKCLLNSLHLRLWNLSDSLYMVHLRHFHDALFVHHLGHLMTHGNENTLQNHTSIKLQNDVNIRNIHEYT